MSMSSFADSSLDAAGPSVVVLVLTTLPLAADAEALAEALVEERLAACVSIGAPMTSVFRWQGVVERAQERQVVLKTVRGKVPLLESRLGALHPYDVPELLVVPVEGGAAAYLAWVRECTGS
jgi:periplasmic divalent cation tolerance protein